MRFWFTKEPPALPGDIELTERALSRTLPARFKELLLEQNGLPCRDELHGWFLPADVRITPLPDVIAVGASVVIVRGQRSTIVSLKGYTLIAN